MRQKREGVVYFIKAKESHLVKIGRTGGGLRERRKSIQNMCPVDLYTLGALRCPDQQKLERELHKLFAPWRRHGEWFSFGDDHIGTLKRCISHPGAEFDLEGFKKYWKREVQEKPYDKLFWRWPNHLLDKHG